MGSLIDEKRCLKNGDSSMLIPPRKCKRHIVSAIRSFPSGFVNEEERHLINGDCSTLTPQLKCKRQIVSAIRSFPSGCGPRGSALCKQKTQGVNVENTDVVSKEVLNDVKSCGEKIDLSEAMGFVNGEEIPLENGEFSMLTPLPKCKRQKVSAVRKFPRGCGPNATSVCKQRVQGVNEPERKGLLEQVASTNCLNEVETVANNKLREGTTMEERCLSPQYPIPSNFVWEEQKNPSPVCGLPADCGRNLKSLGPNNQVIKGKTVTKALEVGILKQNEGFLEESNNCEVMIQETVSGKGGDTHEKPLDIDEGIAEKLITQVRTRGQSSRDKKRKNDTMVFEKDKDEGIAEKLITQVRTRGQSSQDKNRKNDIMVFEKDKDKKIMSSSDGSLPNNNAVITEIERRGIVLGLMRAASCPWSQMKDLTNLSPSCVSANKSKAKKCSYDAQPNQKCSLTKHENSEGKLAEKPNIEEDNKDEQLMQGMEQSWDNGNDGSVVESSLDVLKDDLVVFEKDKDEKIKSMSDGDSCNDITYQQKNGDVVEVERGVIVLSLGSAASSPSSSVKEPAKLSSDEVSAKQSEGKEHFLTKCKDGEEKLTEKPVMDVPHLNEMEQDDISLQLSLSDDDDDDNSLDEENVFEFLPRPRNHDVTLPPSVDCSSSKRGPRAKVQETVRLFEALLKNMLQGEKSNSEENVKDSKSVHLRAANVLKEQDKYINTEKVIGPIPGVEIGDSFSYRLELAIIGLHSPLQSGVETIRQVDLYVATSVVAFGDNPSVLIYTGQGGNPMETRKLDCENLALKNCIDNKTPVRVIRGLKKTNRADNGGRRPKPITTYTYDGLYTVERYWPQRRPRGKLVYKFELIRIPGQPQLTWNEVEQAKNRKLHEILSVDDISNGKEIIPIGAVNAIDDEKPPVFTYITSRIYPDWCRPLPLKGCDCKTGCSYSKSCACTLRNGGEIPYNLSGAIVEAKSLVYECGPSCQCPPSCPGRVGQHGIKLPLEIFKTEFMGWGVRCLSSIPSGSFVCEYIGELLDDKEAEQRIGGDEYLFDIGRNYSDNALTDEVSDVMPEIPSVVENVGFTIDAARYGNIGRFFNHSCSPNLYAQNVLYDHEDERVPHVMLFAAEDIPPLQELTYHYNYTIDQVFDSKGNIKIKKCCCGSDECTGRMY